MTRGIHQNDTVAAAASEVPIVEGAPVRRVKLLPMGVIRLRDGRGPYRLRDRAHAEQVVAATRAYLGTLDFNFDYDHGVQKVAAGAAAEARAAGWVKPDTLSVEDDGIYGDVDWTAAADAALRAREYRYVSPYFVAAKPAQGGDVIHLKNAALVNIGAIDLPAVAAGLSEEDQDMDLTAIAAALGLAATATAEDIAAAVADLRKSASAIAVAAGLAADAKADDVAASVTALKGKADKPDLTGYVPVAVVEPMREQLKTLNGERLGKKVDDLIAAGIVMPAKRKETLDWFEKDEVAATAFFKDMPPIVKPGASLGGQPGADAGADTLTADEVACCAALGMSTDAFLAEKKLQKGGAA